MDLQADFYSSDMARSIDIVYAADTSPAPIQSNRSMKGILLFPFHLPRGVGANETDPQPLVPSLDQKFTKELRIWRYRPN
jgi:hypothetical protein